jgi:pimeloyl-ACP methyl ester carboxylesterase
MARFTHGDVSIRYEESGEADGYPLLLLAPGALHSTVEAWPNAPINPLVAYEDEFRLIAMDQRNAGASTGPFAVDDPWGSFVEDQLRLADHLGIERFHVVGCCIGCSYALKIAELAPDRLSSAVLEQPIGFVAGNQELWTRGWQNWTAGLLEHRDDLDADDAEAFGVAMWEGKEFVASVTRDFVRSCAIPLLVLPGVDNAHPREIGLEVAELAPEVELVDPWRDTPEDVERATVVVRQFLERHVAG